jgi:hypothetical protein
MDRFFGLGVAELIVVLIIGVFAVAALIPWFFIYKKAGFHPAMGCLMFLPLVNVIMLFILAFTEWPLERDLRESRTAGMR